MALVESITQAPGREAPDFDLIGVDNERYTLKDFVFKKGLLIIFTCNHCPYAKASRAPLLELSYQFPDVEIVAINSNDSDAYPEDNFEAMQDYAKKYGISFPYLRDGTQDVAKAYKAACTPDPYLFKNHDGVFKLFYHGRINDNWQDPTDVKERNLEDHMNRLVNDDDPADIWPPSMGCSIKRRS